MRDVRSLLAFAILAMALAVPAAENRAGTGMAWVEVRQSVLPVRDTTTKDGKILGFVRAGEVYPALRTYHNWVKVRVNDSLQGWLPGPGVEPSSAPRRLNLRRLKWALGILAAFPVSIFVGLGIGTHMRRKLAARTEARMAVAYGRRRLQNKVQLLFPHEPALRSHLAQGETGLARALADAGYQVALETDPKGLLETGKAFRPNLILADGAFYERLEQVVERDAFLVNTPVVYLNCLFPPVPSETRVRAFLGPNPSDKEVFGQVALCLRRSPKQIRYSVNEAALKGLIYPGSLADLMHFLSAVKKTGALTVTGADRRGEVVFQLGRIVGARWGKTQGEEAAARILNLRDGSFEFHERPAKTDEEDEGVATEKVLLQWARIKDEADHPDGA